MHITTSFKLGGNWPNSEALFQSAIRARAPFACSFDQSVLTNPSHVLDVLRRDVMHRLCLFGNRALLTPATVTC